METSSSIADPLWPLADLLRRSNYILALAGAGLSAPSGIPTFQDISPWRGLPHHTLASMAGFRSNPLLVWQYHDSFCHTAIQARPNAGHYALAKLADAKPYFFTITQNIDGLSERTGHNASQIVAPHGSIFEVTCSKPSCDYRSAAQHTQRSNATLNLPLQVTSDPAIALPPFNPKQLPLCPKCVGNPLRPGVVWYGEELAPSTYDRIEEQSRLMPEVELLFVIGTSGRLHAHVVQEAREKGALVVHFNKSDTKELVEPGDWFVRGNVAETLPKLIDMALVI